ncbi:attractin-like protein 1 [Asterias amurensis]|uniref:attractin-like protein 1 n=1 Tax=Asterias amurensis TaxID=7602 RepID=UPI003AB2456D
MVVSGCGGCELVILAVIITAFGQACDQHSCPSIDTYCGPGWQKWGNSCYRPINQSVVYSDAEKICMSLGGKIAAPRSAEETKWFVELAGNITEFWIACVKDGEQWLCNGQSQNFTNWFRGIHNDQQRCASLCVTRGEPTCALGKWLPITCDADANHFPAICIIRPNSQPKYCFPTGTNGQLLHESLVNHIITELPTPTVVGCGRACANEPQCRSFNIMRDGQTLLCQLNNATRCDEPGDFRQNTEHFSLYSDDIWVEHSP